MGIYIMATSIAPTVINPHVLKTKYNTTRLTIKNSLFLIDSYLVESFPLMAILIYLCIRILFLFWYIQ